MKRIVTLSILAMMVVMLMAPMAFADTFKVVETSPSDNAKGVPIDNVGLKVTFSENVYSKKYEESNAKACKLIEVKEVEDKDGKIVKKDGPKIPVLVVVNPEEQNTMMVLADGKEEKAVASDKSYRFEIDENFKSADGSTLQEELKVSFKTQNTNTTMMISMGMMVVMVVGMVIVTSKSAKKEAEKKEKDKEHVVNPYKEAKATGKSVEEIVAREAKKKAKLEEKKKRQKEENKKEIASNNIRVSKPRPISAAGATYKHPINKKTPPKQKQGTNVTKKKGGQKKKSAKKK